MHVREEGEKASLEGQRLPTETRILTQRRNILGAGENLKAR